MRVIARTAFKWLLNISPVWFRYRAANLPFSRFHRWIPFLFKGTVKISYRNIFIYLNPGETVGYHPFFFGSNPDDEVSVLIRACREARTFADIGANIGLVSLPLAKALPHIDVHAFEPDPLIAAKFRANLGLNPELASRVRLVEKAASNQTGEVKFHSEADSCNEGTGRITDSGGVTIEAVRLDDHFAGQAIPDVIKMDIEGGELHAIEGMQAWSQESAPRTLLIEVHGFYFGKEGTAHNQKVAAALAKAGYGIERLDGGRLVDAGDPRDWPMRLHLLATKCN